LAAVKILYPPGLDVASLLRMFAEAGVEAVARPARVPAPLFVVSGVVTGSPRRAIIIARAVAGRSGV